MAISLTRFGKKSFKEVLEPAIDYAENGHPVHPKVGNDWPSAVAARSSAITRVKTD